MLYHSRVHSIQDILGFNYSFDTPISDKNSYSIPLNQREFVWKKEKAKKLLNDIHEAYRSKDEYFIGGIVLSVTSMSNNKRTLDVIDGQQRLTTITICIASIIAYYKSNKTTIDKEFSSFEVANHYSDQFTTYKKLIKKTEAIGDKIQSNFTLNTSDAFKDFYEELLNRLDAIQVDGDIAEEIDDLLPSAKGNEYKTNMLDVAYSANEFLGNFDDDGREFIEFVDFLLSKVSVIVTITQNLGSAFKVFETLNDRGVKLLPEHLIKNYIMMRLKDNDLKLCHDRWEQFLTELKEDQSTTEFKYKPTDFFSLYYLSKGESFKKGDLFDKFQEYEQDTFKNSKKALAFIEDLKIKAKFLLTQTRIQHSLNKIDFGLGYSTILALYPYSSDTDYAKYVEQICRLGFVLLICKDKRIREHLQSLNTKIANYNSSTSDLQLIEVITNFVSKVIEENHKSTFEGNLEVKKIPFSGKLFDQMKYMLCIMAKKLDGTHFDLNSSKTTIEHILPKKDPNDPSYPDYGPDYDHYKKKIGNLTILNGQLNSSISNGSFKDKIDEIQAKSNNNYLTASIYKDIDDGKGKLYVNHRKAFNYKRGAAEDRSSINSWTRDDIENRTKALSRLARYIWIENHL